MKGRVKIMVVDDSITYRQILSEVVQGFDQAELMGTASSGRTALLKLGSLKPDLIFLDVMMPEMDGIETLIKIKEQMPKIQVVMVSAFNMENAKATLQSLDNGALDFIAKPTAKDQTEGLELLSEALQPLVNLIYDRLNPEQVKLAPRPVELASKQTEIKKIDYVLIGVSTGGPNALQRMFESLSAPLPCPVLVVQHMPPLFTTSLAERLDTLSPMNVMEAKSGEVPQKGFAYIAPGGKHMILKRKSTGSYFLEVTDTPPVNHCKPAVDVLFASMALHHELFCLSVIMTGMGHDGTQGVGMLKKNGTHCLVQDEASSVVWGMPGSVVEAKHADEILPLEKLSQRISSLTSQHDEET